MKNVFSCLYRGKGFYREVVRLAIPIVLQNLITNSLGLLDTFMVGGLGEAPMAAVTMANTPIFVVLLMVFGMQSGSSVLIAQYHGKGDYAAISKVLGIGVYLSGGVNFLFGCVMFFLPEQFMSLYGNDAAVIALAAQYAKTVAFSFVFDGLAQLYIAAHRSMSNPKLGLAVLGSAMVSNTFLNWVFIFGNLGAPKLGVTGAALATLLSRIIEFLIALGHMAFNKSFRVKLSHLLRPGREMLSRYVRYATPVLLNETLWGLGTSLYPTIMGHMDGSKAILAAYGISGNLEKVTTVIVFALAATAAIIVGREVGAGQKRDTVYRIGVTLDLLSVLAGLTVGVTMLLCTFTLFGPYLYPMFNLSPEAAGIATLMNTVTFLVLPIRAFNTTNVVGVLRGGGDVKAAMVIDDSPLWLVALPFAAICGLALNWGVIAVVIAMALENLVKFFLGMYRLRSGAWIRDVTTT